MGYRIPDPDPFEEKGFSAQFEWQEKQLLFRRNRRDPPVQVRADERDRAIDVYQTRMKRSRIGIAVVTAVAILAFVLTDDTGDERESLALFAIVMASILLWELASHWAARSATSAFDHRTPVGPPRSRTERRKAKVANQTLGTLMSGGALAMVALLGPWPPHGLWAWFGLVVGTIGAFTALVDIGLRVLQKRG